MCSGNRLAISSKWWWSCLFFDNLLRVSFPCLISVRTFIQYSVKGNGREAAFLTLKRHASNFLPLKIQMPSKLGINRNFLSLAKGIYQKPTANIILLLKRVQQDGWLQDHYTKINIPVSLPHSIRKCNLKMHTLENKNDWKLMPLMLQISCFLEDLVSNAFIVIQT